MTHSLRGAICAAALTLCFMTCAPDAKADTYDFTLSASQGGPVLASGTFLSYPTDEYGNTTIHDVTGTFHLGSGESDIVSGYGFLYPTQYYSPITLSGYFASISVSSLVTTSGSDFSGPAVGSINEQLPDGTERQTSLVGAFFSASVSAPASSGGAPTAEVDAFAGILAAGATAALLLRGGRRGVASPA